LLWVKQHPQRVLQLHKRTARRQSQRSSADFWGLLNIQAKGRSIHTVNQST
jgi:hypothetical protein